MTYKENMGWGKDSGIWVEAKRQEKRERAVNSTGFPVMKKIL